MSLQIYIAHTGERLLADPVSFASYVVSRESPLLGRLPWNATDAISNYLGQTHYGHGSLAVLPSRPRGRS